MPEQRSNASGIIALLVGVGAVAVCCGAPVLVAAIAALGSGAALSGALPVVGVLVTAALLIAGVVVLLWRHIACAPGREPAPRPSAPDRAGTTRP